MEQPTPRQTIEAFSAALADLLALLLKIDAAPPPAASPPAELAATDHQQVDQQFADLIGDGSPDHPVQQSDLNPLTENDINLCKGWIKALKPDQRQAFTIAYRAHFNIPSTTKTISGTIQQVQHARFIENFVHELETQGNG